MNTHRQQFTLIILMVLLTVLISGITIFFLYDAAFKREESNLSEMVRNEISLIEAVARFDQQNSQDAHPEGARAATIGQVVDAYNRQKGFGTTGEILVAQRGVNSITFLNKLRHKHDLGEKLTVAYDTPYTEPMRRAINQQSGFMLGKDYRGENVLAAYGWIDILDIGIVAKIDLDEIRTPFIASGFIVIVVAALFIFIASAIIMRITRNSIRELEYSEEQKRLLLNSTGEAIYGIDHEGNCTFANPACVDILGYGSDSELLGKNMHALIHHSLPDGSPYPLGECSIYKAFRTGDKIHIEDEVFWRKDGSSFEVEYRSHPILQHGECIGAVVSFSDVSAQYQLQYTLERNEDTLSRAQAIAHVGHWDWDIVSGDLLWSDEIYRIFDLNPQEFDATYEAFLERVHPDDRDAVTAAINRSLANPDIPYDIEHRIITPDNTEKIVHERGEIYCDAAGKPVRMIGIVHDITDTKNAITALSESEEKFQTLARVSPVGIFHTDAKGRCTYVNEYWCRLTGLKEHEAQGDGWLNALHPEDINRVNMEWNESVRENRNFKLEYRFLHPNGHEVWVLGQSKAERDGNENIVGFVGSITDITERKHSELALQKSEHDVHTILDNMVDTFYRSNSHGEIIMVSQSIKRLLGYDPREVIGKNISVFYSRPEDRSQFLQYIDDHNGHAIGYEVTLRHKDGRDIWVSTNAHYIYNDNGTMVGIEGVAHDITARKNAEQAMLELNSELENRVNERSAELINERNFITTVLNTTCAIVTVLDTEGKIVRFNRTSEVVSGYAADEVIGKHVWDIFITADEVDEVREVFNNITAGMFPNTHENYWLTKDKRKRLISWSNSAICNESGQVKFIIATGIDVTDRKLTEKALSESQNTLSMMVGQLHGMLYRCLNDKHWTMTFVNEGCQSLTGYSVNDYLSGTVSFGDNVIHPEDQQAVWESVQRGLDEKRPYELNYRILTADKKVKWVLEHGIGHFSSNGELEALEGFIVDNTENKNIEVQLKQTIEVAEKASQAKSEFLSRMSHELRTPMNAILGFGQLLQSDEDNNLSEENMDFLNEIMNAGNHLLELINEVLDLSRIESGKANLNIDALPPYAVISECISLITPIADMHDIKLVNRCEGIQDVRIRADRTRLKQILINLMTNAVKYNTKKGSVRLSCEYIEPARMRISVSDTGPGIPEDQQERMFKPFERLDDSSDVEGTGIGLAVTKRLVDMMNGTLGVDSSPGRGSTFWIEFDAKRITAPKSVEDTVSAAIKPYQLLLIEDVPAKIKLISQILAKRTDIELLTARTAESGLDTASKLCPDAILLNHDMSALHEFHLLEKLISTKHTQNIPLLAMSADANEPQQVQKILDKGVNMVFSDPLDVSGFLEKLEHILPRQHKQQNTESVKNIQ